MMYLMAVFALGELCGMPELVFGIRIAFLAAFFLLLFADVFLRRSEKKDFKSGRSVIFPLFLFLAGIVISLNSHYAFRSDEKLFGEITAERASVIAEGEIEDFVLSKMTGTLKKQTDQGIALATEKAKQFIEENIKE